MSKQKKPVTYIASKQLTLKNAPNAPKIEVTQVKNSRSAYEVLMSFWNIDQIEIREEFHILMLNRNNKIIGHSVISIGGTAGTVADGKIIFSTALQTAGCSAIILAHNHPSGQLNPSEMDKNLTSKLTDFGKMIDLNILDHLILSVDGYFSFADEGLM